MPWEPPLPAGAVSVCGEPPVAPVCDPLGGGLLTVLGLVLWVPAPVDRLGLIVVTTGVVWTGVWLVTAGVTCPVVVGVVFAAALGAEWPCTFGAVGFFRRGVVLLLRVGALAEVV